MAGGATTTFATVQSEGGVLPHDLLVQIARRSDALPGLADADFGLEPGLALRDLAAHFLQPVVSRHGGTPCQQAYAGPNPSIGLHCFLPGAATARPQ